MRLPRLAIDNAAFVWMVVIFLAVFGARAYFEMPRTENPEVTVPGASVFVIMPGGSSIDLERMVAMPLEEALNALEDIKSIFSEVRDGFAVVSVEFEFSSDAEEKYDKFVQQVNSVRNDLPSEISQLETWQWSIADMSMMQLALLSEEATWEELKDLAEAFQKRVEKMDGIRKVTTFGLPGKEIEVALDFEKMAMVNTTMNQVIQAIQGNNVNIPGGDVELGAVSLSVKSSGAYQHLDEIRNTVVNAYRGKLIRLQDLADVRYGYESRDHITRYGAKYMPGEGAVRGIFIGISQKEGVNVLATAKALEPVLDIFSDALPPGTRMEEVFNQADTVSGRVNGFIGNLLQGMLLVALVIFLSLGIRSAVIVALAIPMSLLIGLGFVDLAGFGLQQISIAGLVVVLGMLVDNSIVMVENINRYIQLGHSRREASFKAASEIGWPVVSATFTTILAFMPIAAMPEMVGAFIKSLPVTIMVTLAVSLLLALAFTPVLTSRLLKERRNGGNSGRGGDGAIGRSSADGVNSGDGGRGGNGRIGNGVFGFSKALNWVVAHPFRTSLRFAMQRPGLTLLLAVLYLGISSWMFQYIGISFFPKAEQPSVMVQTMLPEGMKLGTTDKVARHIESVLDTMPEVRSYAANVGHGNPRIYYNVFSRRNDKRFAEHYVEVYDDDPLVFAQTVAKLRSAFEGYPGVRINVKEFEQGPPYDAPVQIFIIGEELEVLRELSAEVEALIADQPGAINIENEFVKTNTALLFDINKEKANMLGVPVIEIDRTVRAVVSGLEVGKFRDPEGEEVAIKITMAGEGEFRPDDLGRVYVSSLSGRQIPIGHFVELVFRQVPSSINRFDLERTAELKADVRPGYTLDEVIVPVMEELERMQWPSGYTYHVGGELEGRNESFGGMGNAVLIAILSIFAVLVLQFRSVKQPLLVFVAVPFAFTGMIWALLITGETFSFTAFVGLTSLVGIVVNNSIILVDYTNVLRKRGSALTEAVMQAAETRLIPIVLTALTTIGGLIPLTLFGGSMWGPMGWTIIGGLTVSTFLTLLIVPVCYFLFERCNQ